MRRLAWLLAPLVAMTPAATVAQSVSFAESFQQTALHATPNDWATSLLAASSEGGRVRVVRQPANSAAALRFETAADPLQPGNVVFGPVDPPHGAVDREPRAGALATLTTRTFGARHFEFRGRFFLANQDARAGLAFLSSTPERDRWTLIGLWPAADGAPSMQLFSAPQRSFSGSRDSHFRPPVGQWTRFVIRTDDDGSATTIRARFWPESGTEPSSDAIVAVDASAARPREGRIGLWGAMAPGIWFDDVSASSHDDTSVAITFRDRDSGKALDPSFVALFSRDAHLIVETNPSATVSLTLDGAAVAGAADSVAAERAHTLVAHAVAVDGGVSEETLHFVVDKSPPVLTLHADAASFADGALFGHPVSITAAASDLTAVTLEATADGHPATFPIYLADEVKHTIAVSGVDALGWKSSLAASLTIDLTPPTVVLLANGHELASGSTFDSDVALSWQATDAHLVSVDALLDSAPIASGAIASSEAQHAITVMAVDGAGNRRSVTRTFTISRQRPSASLLVNGAAFADGTLFNVPLQFSVSSSVKPQSVSAQLDGAPWDLAAPVSVEGPHTLQITLTFAVGAPLVLGPFHFGLDRTPPQIELFESGAPFIDGSKFSRDVLPTIVVHDEQTAQPLTTLLVDGQPYPQGQPIVTESAAHTIAVSAVDDAGNRRTLGPLRFLLDKSKPVVTITDVAGKPVALDALFRAPVSFRIVVADLTHTTLSATLTSSKGTVPFDLGAGVVQPDGRVVYTSAPVAIDEHYALTVIAVDEVGLSSDPVVATFRLDQTPVSLRFTEPAAGALVATPKITVRGIAGNAVTVTVNGKAAQVDPSTGTFVAEDVPLVEGRNELVAVGSGDGIEGSATLVVTLDTRAPEVVVASPAAGACLSASSVTVSGTAVDPNLVSLTVSLAGTTTTATPDGEHRWSATLPLASEGEAIIAIDARDALGHQSSASIRIIADRTPPSIELLADGQPFTGGSFNHPLTFLVRARDADPTAQATARLNGQAYLSGVAVSSPGSYTLTTSAHDCAGNAAPEATVSFVIDTTAPKIVSLDPAEGTTISTRQHAIAGTIDADDLQSVAVEATSLLAAISGRSFTIAGVPLVEGANGFVLILTDRAGNVTRQPLSFRVKSSLPAVEILESEAPIAAGALFRRPVHPVIRSNESGATITATIDGAPFTSGNEIGGEGSHQLSATASDAYGHTSAAASVSFTIDTIAPTVNLTAPAAGSQTDVETIAVRGTTTGGDVTAVSVNGAVARLAADGSFDANVPLEPGANLLVVTAADRAGNLGTASVEVTRNDGRPGLILLTPPDRSVTNHSTLIVSGQLLTPKSAAKVTVNGVEVAVDASGAFRRESVGLTEGDNAITAAIGGTARSITVHVTADFTPPVLHIQANGAELADGANFAAAPSITLQVTDAQSVTTSLIADGSVALLPLTTLNGGAHKLVAVARDAPGNETRSERTLFVGAGSSGAPCTLTTFDPPDRSVVTTPSIQLTGRAGGASAVLVNGARAQLSSGTFLASVNLTAEGANALTIACADAGGVATNDPTATLALYRESGAPSIAITAPPSESIVTTGSVTVSGAVGPEVVSGDVDGIAFAPINGTFSVSNVLLANGLNVITARGRSGGGRTGVATANVILANAPPQIAITSPLPGTETGAATVDVSGSYANGDPSTLSVTSGAVSWPVSVHANSDTTGTFVAVGVALAPGATTTLTAAIRNRASVLAQATTDVRQLPGAPAITIAAPADNTVYRADQNPEPIAGAISPIVASSIRINGVETPADGAFHFSAAVKFAGTTLSLPVVARVTTPDGKSASAAIRLLRMSGPLRVLRSFPEAGAPEVDRGVVLVVLMSNPLDGATVRSAMSLADESGQTLTGTLYVDRDSISFAPQVPLAPGRHYTLTISQSMKDLAGGTLAAPFTLGFTTASSAAAVAPLIDQSDQSGCLSAQSITGKASVPGARVRLDLDGVLTVTTATGDGRFSFSFTLAGGQGFHIARVREVGSDGTLSPERDVSFRVDCGGPQILAATLDRSAKHLVLQFSRAMNAATLVASGDGTILLVPTNGTPLTGAVSWNAAGDEATVMFDALPPDALALTITTGARDSGNVPLAATFTRTFPADTAVTSITGNGYVSGAVYDATTGRPLAGATVAFSGNAAPATTDEQGRYARSLPEGVTTIVASKVGFTTAWRQLIVPAGAQVVPIDLRLAHRGIERLTDASAITVTHFGDPILTRKAEAIIPPSALAPGHRVTVTSVDGQSIAGLLPLGWSPLASAELVVDGETIGVPLPGATLSFELTATDVTAIAAAHPTLSIAQYDQARDEWRVVVAVASIDSATRRIVASIAGSGSFALVDPDSAPGLTLPPAAHAGALLVGVADPCSVTPVACSMTSRSFTFEPKSIPPDGRAAATLITNGAGKRFPSGTVVQASIDEQLNLADGRVLSDAPFTTDLIVYRTIAGDEGLAQFALAPSPQAVAVTLRDGADRVTLVDNPARVERGSLIGPAGGRVPGDESMSLDVPDGAATEPLHIAMTPLTPGELAALPPVAGFHVAGGFTLALRRADSAPAIDLDGDGIPDPVPVTLSKSARGTFAVSLGKFASANRQAVVAEVLGSTPFGLMVRLAATAALSAAPSSPDVVVAHSDSPDPALLPVDGIIREGRYLILTADAPIAFAWGTVRLGGSGAVAVNARVQSGIGAAWAAPLGVTDLTRATGLFATPVAASPAAAFSLRPDSRAQGAGAIAVNPSALSPATSVRLDLTLDAQPPHLLSIAPRDVERDAFAGLQVQVTFDAAIDPASVAGGVTLTNAGTGVRVSGTVAAAGAIVTFTPSEPLAPAATWIITVLPSIRAVVGAPFGQTASAQFTTPPLPPPGSVHPERIQITLPANGVSIIRGSAGALPSGDGAVAVRRGRFFATQYQATAAADGSFQFSAGAIDGLDRIRTDDVIDLHVIDAVSHSTIAILPLTPFVTAEGDGFLAPPDLTTRFLTKEGIALTVPAGAFDDPTIVRANVVPSSTFAAVPDFAQELRPLASVRIDFDGVARQRIDVDLPVTGVLDPARQYYLGGLFDSARGPRIMLVDTLRIAGTSLTTTLPSAGASMLRPGSQSLRRAANAIPGITNIGEAKGAMLGVVQRGNYSAVDVVPPMGWMFTTGLGDVDVFISTFHSLFTAGFYLSQKGGKAFIPVVANAPFVMTGVDSGTGLSVFTKSIDHGIPPGDPLSGTPLPPPTASSHGPYPTFASPGRIESVEVNAPQFTDSSHRGLVVTYDRTSDSQLHVDPSPSVSASGRWEVLNVTTGAMQSVESIAEGLRIAASPGDRVILLGGEQDVDPEGNLSVVFSEPIATATALAQQFEIASADAAGRSFNDITAQATFTVDSGGRRVNVLFPSGLIRGRKYRVTLRRTIQSEIDGTSGHPLHLGEAIDEKGTVLNGPNDLHFTFTTRAPAGSLGTFRLGNPCAAPGSIASARDFALSGNILFAAASGGGLLAYDVSDPAALARNAAPFAWAPDGGVSDTWSVAADAHGRIWTTSLTEAFGVVREYTTDSFIDAKRSTPVDCNDLSSKPVPPLRAGLIVSYRPGFVEALPLSTASSEVGSTLTTKPEAIPRKLQLLVQDDTSQPMTTEELAAKLGGQVAPVAGNAPFERIALTVPYPATGAYYVHRVTLRNTTLGLSWSKDVLRGATASFNILARPGDSWIVATNLTTYGVVSLFGFGIGIYDLNALESNRYTPADPKGSHPLEQVLVSDGVYRAQCSPTDPQKPPDPWNTGNPFDCIATALASIGQHCPIPDLSLTPETIALPAAAPQFTIYGLSPSLGIVDLSVVPPMSQVADALPTEPACTPRNPGLTLASRIPWPNQDSPRVAFDHPRLNTLRKLYEAAASKVNPPGHQPFARFSSIALYTRRTSAAKSAPAGTPDTIVNYGLIAARDYGLLVVRLDPSRPLDNDSLVDVVWIPVGAYSVRTVDGSALATVIDGAGRVLLIDLTRIDESSKVPASPMTCTSPDQCTAPLFPTAAAAIAGPPPQVAPSPAQPWIEIGADDPRILWKSAPSDSPNPSTLAPVIDPESGILYRGDYNDPNAKIVAASDPRLRFLADLGNPPRMTEISGVTPLGIRPANCAPGTLCDTTGSAFHVEVSLPGSMAESIAGSNGRLRLAIESELLPGAPAAQTPAPLPRAHLRTATRTGAPDPRPTDFALRHVLPESADPDLQRLRYQRAWNRWTSPTIVALADPRAGREWSWTGSKEDEGCFGCDRPTAIAALREPDVYELMSMGRFISVKFDGAFSGALAFAGGDRLRGRIATIMADTVRPTSVATAPQNPPVAGGLLQETTYLHSGEVELHNADLDAGGRNGWNVAVDRTYRSRTLGASPFGAGWDSSIAKRLRLLPNGDVELRDGSGEIYLFGRVQQTYRAPDGLFLSLSRTSGGWSLIDQQRRVSMFDDFGRLILEGDEFFQFTGGGNAIAYRYDAAGRLSSITDPVGRVTTLQYYSDDDPSSGLLKEVTDWRRRSVTYGYDSGRLSEVRLPATENTDGVARPAIRYGYQSFGSYTDAIRLGTNIQTVTDPHEVATGGRPRITFNYGTSGGDVDRVLSQKWGTDSGELATFAYAGSNTDVKDVLGQVRHYSLVGSGSTAHVVAVQEDDVPRSKALLGTLPSTLDPAAPSIETAARSWTFSYNPDGTLQKRSMAGAGDQTHEYVAASALNDGALPGVVPKKVEISGSGVEPISRTLNYSSGAFLDSIADTDGSRIESHEPSRNTAARTVDHNDVDEETHYDTAGRATEVISSHGTDPLENAPDAVQVRYAPDGSSNLWERGAAIETIHGEQSTKATYAPFRTTFTDARGVVTTTALDGWLRAKEVSVAGTEQQPHESSFYDASGRLVRQERKQGFDLVVTRYGYDEVGRPTSQTIESVPVNGTLTNLTTTTRYDLPNRRAVVTSASGATTTSELDGLGRVTREVLSTGSSPIERRYAYDLLGNRVYSSDLLMATAEAYDLHGRHVGSLLADGSRTTRAFDHWGNLSTEETRDTSNQVVESMSMTSTPAGRTKSVQEKVDSSLMRTTESVWDGGGRSTGMAVSGRARRTRFDPSGREILATTGAGSATAITDPFVTSQASQHLGWLPGAVTTTEKEGDRSTASLHYDTLGNATNVELDRLTFDQHFDESGNRIESTPPARGTTTTGYDVAGRPKKETIPGGTNTFVHDANGVLAKYTDPDGEATSVDADLIGRPVKRHYADTTTESFEYDGGRLKSVTDRQGRRQIFTYNSKGQLTLIELTTVGPVDKLEYDAAGRLIRWTNSDSEVLYDSFNLDGKPQSTALTRFKPGTAFTTREVMGQYIQEHRWNEHGERVEWTMPRPSAFTSAAPWTDRVFEHHDALGNVDLIERTRFGAMAKDPLVSASFRNAGRPVSRAVQTSCTAGCATASTTILRDYGYEESTGMGNRMTVRAKGLVVAGSAITGWSGLLLRNATLLGVSDDSRSNLWNYDPRGRLLTVNAGRVTEEKLSPGDFRLQSTPESRLDAATRTQLAARGMDVRRIDPSPASFTPSAAHKIATMQRGASIKALTFNGGELASDGHFAYEWDEKGRLRRATELVAVPAQLVLMRVTYAYDGNDRMIGRRVESAPVSSGAAGAWQLATPALMTDGLPPEATMVWDPVSDRLVAVYDAATGALVRQVVHGGLGYDDPIEVTLTDPVDASKPLQRLYPVYDEAGAGSLQVVLNMSGEVVSRSVQGDAYGDERTTFAGAAIDRVQLRASKDATGVLAQVEIELRSTEVLRATSLGSGVRIAGVDGAGNVVHTATVAASPAGDFTAKVTLTGSEWSSMTTGATAVSIAATRTLRAANWAGDLPILPVPPWIAETRSVSSSASLPVEVRESLSNLTATVSAIAPSATTTLTLYEIPDLALLGSATDADDPSRLLLASPFQSLPFVDRVTHHSYARARWLNHQTGTFLTPDPMGYRDSANLYAFVGGDPVNGRDPRGRAVYLLYREFDDADLRKAYPALGHFYLAFDEEELNDVRHWRRLVNRLGQNARVKRNANSNAETFSFHPKEVETGDKSNSLVWTAYTRGSYIDYNNPDPDQSTFARARAASRMKSPIPFITIEANGARMWKIASTQAQQERLYVAVSAQRDAINGDLNSFGSYTLGANNCGSWARAKLLDQDLPYPLGAELYNLGGAGIGGPMDETYRSLTVGMAVLGEANRAFNRLPLPAARTPPNWIDIYNQTMSKIHTIPTP